LFSSRIDDVVWTDTFRLPSFFDPKARFYKEWHDFAFYDRGSGIFALMNFGVHGNPYDAKRGYGAALTFMVEPGGKAHAAMRLMPLRELTVSPFSPDFVGNGVSVSCVKKNSFRVQGEIGDISLDLNLPIMAPPVTIDQMGYDMMSGRRVTDEMRGAASEMSSLWDTWVELPSLGAFGKINIGGASYSVNTNTGYQDHEGGRFDWGTVKGWDIGVLLCDPTTGREPAKVSFLFYRYGASGAVSYGGIIFRTSSGKEKRFGSECVEIVGSGEFSGERVYLPGITRLLYPDYRPPTPATVRFSAHDLSDRLEIVFTPKAVCTIVAAGALGEGETTFNEMFCGAAIRAKIGGESYHTTIPCWFESVRPRGRLKEHAPET
jgi:hypothetical protein